MATYVYARPQWFLRDNGTHYTDGYDHVSVVARARTLNALARKAGDWLNRAGYAVYDEQSEEYLGGLAPIDERNWTVERYE